MIFFDTTSASSWRHSSGLVRVSRRLLAELGGAATGAAWPAIGRLPAKSDWIFTPEIFAESDRPGFGAFLEKRPCRLAALYHDAIPIKHPDITWPKSVARHPSYMKMLSRFDRVWAVSSASRAELLEFWKWQGVTGAPPVDVLPLGADWGGIARGGASGAPAPGPARIVSVGILEPRKNQAVILDACESLRREGLEMELHLVGRINPHFGAPLAKKVAEAGLGWKGLRQHRSLDDAGLAKLIGSARATAFASIAEGCGLPLLESLWLGVPCVCSAIASLAENAAGGGCLLVHGGSPAAWADALRQVLTDDALRSRLAAEAASRPLPTWAGAARIVREALA
jgi:glycosyltransferase involved in cell wall biosynthesis